MKRMIMLVLATIMLLMLFGGCSLMEQFGLGEKPAEEVLVNGTNTGNILNYGIGVKDGDDIIFVNTVSNAYPLGSVVRSNPETGDNSLVLDEGGLYMSNVSGVLYYCRPDGIYKTALDDPQPVMLIEGDAKQLQISGGKMYYIMDGSVQCAWVDGSKTDFTPLPDADWLNVYGEAIYYQDTQSGHIYKATKDGAGAEVFFDTRVDMFFIISDVVYFIDSTDGYMKRMVIGNSSKDDIETVVAYRCGGFNVNASGMYYTREVDGVHVCCNAGYDGAQEKVIKDFGDSKWHTACMFGGAALVVRMEDIEALW